MILKTNQELITELELILPKANKKLKRNINAMIRVLVSEINTNKRNKKQKYYPMLCQLTPKDIEKVKSDVIEFFDITHEELMHFDKNRVLGMVRFTVIYILRCKYLSLLKCGAAVGRTNHSSAINAYNYIDNLIKEPVYQCSELEKRTAKFINNYLKTN